jgi:hypothetical protein
MLEIRLVGFQMVEMEELDRLIAEALNSHGLKAAGFVIFDASPTRRCLDNKPHPHVVVCSDDQQQLNIAALQINATLGVTIKKELCLEFLLPLPIDDWSDRGR